MDCLSEANSLIVTFNISEEESNNVTEAKLKKLFEKKLLRI